MTAPKRVQLRRTKGWRLPPNTVSVAYPTKWQNPHRKLRPRGVAVAAHAVYLDDRPDLVTAAPVELGGKHLACWCPLDEPCHADTLLDLANRRQPCQT